MGLLSEHICGNIATKEVAYAKKKPIFHSSDNGGGKRVNRARKQIYATIFCSFARKDGSPCRPRVQQ